MLKYELISPKLIISNTAYRVYRVSASVSIFLFLPFCVILSQTSVARVITPFAQLLFFVFALSVACTFVGMEVFLFRFDKSPAWKQVFWFCVLLLPLFGPAAYCFFVYSRSDVFKARAEQAYSASAL